MQFESFKRETLSNIESGVDFSPKGSIDTPILDLVSLINSHPNYVTTSTCSGRISLFYQNNLSTENKGVERIIVKHGIICKKEILSELSKLASSNSCNNSCNNSFVFLKAEPLIFHIACKDVESARSLHTLVLQVGYRESGVTLGQKKTMLAIRTTAFLFETIVARGETLLVSDEVLDIYVEQCNSRLQSNFERLEHLLLAIKHSWNFPYLTVSKYDFSKADFKQALIETSMLRNLSQRWGHSVTTSISKSSSAAATTVINSIGGYGLDSNSSTSRRGISDFTLNRTKNCDSLSMSQPLHDLMHSCTVDNVKSLSTGFGDISLLITSGGRKGPQQAMPAIVSIYISSSSSSSSSSLKQISFREVGDVPLPRWGHSVTKYNNGKSLLLFGGRSERDIFSDVYSIEIFLEKSSSRTSSDSSSGDVKLIAVVSWKKMDLINTGDSSLSSLPILPAVFFHSACDVSVHVLNDHNDLDKRSYSVVLIVGGLSSIDQMTENTAVFALVPGKNLYYNVNCAPQISKSKSSTDVLIDSCQNISRFGHTLSNLNNGKTLLLIGGISLLNPDFNKLYGNVVIVDYYMCYSKLYSSSSSSSSSISSSEISEISENFGFIELRFRIPAYSNPPDDANIDCQECRLHHQCALIAPEDTLMIIGGGAHALGFGAHYCQMACVRFGVVESAAAHAQKERGILVDLGSSDSKLGGGDELLSSKIAGRYPVVLSLKSNVKDLKTKLEELKLYDKSKKIVEFDRSSGEILDERALGGSGLPSDVALMAIPVVENGLDAISKTAHHDHAFILEKSISFGYQITGKIGSNSNSSSNMKTNSDGENSNSDYSISGSSSSSSSDYSKSGGGSVGGGNAKSTGENRDSPMPVPISPESESRYPVVLSLKSNVKDLKTKLEELKLYDKSKRIVEFDRSSGEILDERALGGSGLPSDVALMAIPVVENGLDAISKTAHHDHAFILEKSISFGYQSASNNPFAISKSLAHNTYRLAESYLDAVRAKLSLPSDAKDSYPIKYELVGNVLMIADESLSGSHWNWLLQNGACNSSSANNDALVDPAAFWRGLAECFHANRVARKSRIDPGPLRESRVNLIYYPGIDGEREEDHPKYKSDVGSNSQLKSWVEVTENGIHFGFDLIRVMFCSGNVTERMRMGKINMCKDETIVDFYAGIGYYTVPFLYYGNAKFVHACDHNPNSCYSLQYNLNKMKIASSRYKIYLNDNKITSRELVNLADRICLGLLPSSEDGWPLAVRALKATGGIIHVHENVHEDKIDSWKEYCVNKFEKYFVDAEKPMKVSCIWVEKVKSYSPKILHIVADLVCAKM